VQPFLSVESRKYRRAIHEHRQTSHRFQSILMIPFILVCILALVAVILLPAARRPSQFRIQRSAHIEATPDAMFPLIDNLRENARWLPYHRKDPAMSANYSEPERGVGACVDFDGNKNVGSGRVTITRGVPSSEITMRLQMMKPFSADNPVEFSLAPRGRDTEVTWAMHGDSPFFIKVMHLFCDMAKMMGRDFDAGLAALKSVVEQGALA
jgi:hypothetical protein